MLKWGHNCVELGTQLCPWKTGDFLVSKWGHNCVGGPKPGSSPFQHRKIPFPPNQLQLSATLGGTAIASTAVQVNVAPTVGYSFVSYIPPQVVYNTSPSFAWGINTDAFYQQSALSMSGTNTQSGNVFWNATYSAPTPTGGHRLDIFAHYDMILIIDPVSKQMTVKY